MDATTKSSPSAKDESHPTVLVGISGCSCSGKTTLALTIARLFGGVLKQELQNSPPASGSHMDMDATVTIISQDDYFVPKEQCPLTSFVPRKPVDEKVVVGKTRADGTVAAYDVDCLEAVDWARMWSDVCDFADGNLAAQQESLGNSASIYTLASADPNSAHRCELQSYLLDASLMPRRHALDQVIRVLREEMSLQVKANREVGYEGKYFKLGPRGPVLVCRLVVVEGFLIEAMGPTNDRGDREEEDAGTAMAMKKKCQQEIKARMDVGIFLHITQEEAVKRRFSRLCYVDAPVGSRLPGQTWKTEGYFRDVGWRNHELYHQSHAGLHGGEQKDVEDWVVDILLEMKRKEQIAREEAVEARKAVG